ncbi:MULTISPECIES: DUF3813 family protein [Oceanobacillus]|uniref:Flp pilus assembly protein TadG n=2 Tax=Oceanobacillus TaxID=182709 RepID=A0A9X0YSN7_9BACI|nr:MULTISPECIES: DUF3813 family protein [Oceanobacillus]MBR3119109.1 DUF3813 family protein [Oceanobacillus sp.]PAE29543.1 hypothetical protein CHI07_08630 [Paenibacillus sp. 7884-2]MBP2076610.1 Flp pilus assembly protein TadG [Oceanobacillus polygoni]MCM3399235.1 DUF3813 family protein [Oceanobacillus profundus]MDO6449267.1 DUF3813 family protein [Oceanobacillus profundus]
MQNNLFQQAKDAVSNMMMQGNANSQDKQAAQNAVQAAYTEATPEERNQLQQLEQQLKQHNQLQ